MRELVRVRVYSSGDGPAGCAAEDAVELRTVSQGASFVRNPFTDKIFYSVALRNGLECTPRLVLLGA